MSRGRRNDRDPPGGMDRHRVHHRHGEPQPRRHLRQPGRAVHQPARQQNALAAGYHDSYVHPSEPNYLWLVAGENFGILNDNDPGSSNHIASTSHLADQIEQAGLSWKAYQECMGGPCGLSSHGDRTQPSTIRSSTSTTSTVGTAAPCMPRSAASTTSSTTRSSTPISRRASSPTYVFITPNMVHDMHDGSVATATSGCRARCRRSSAPTRSTTAASCSCSWDEGGGYPQADDPPFIAISPQRQARLRVADAVRRAART